MLISCAALDQLLCLPGLPHNSRHLCCNSRTAAQRSWREQVTGSITYNGRDFSHFVPEQTATFVNQSDLHLPEMTVRETLDHGARMQGIGFRGGTPRSALDSQCLDCGCGDVLPLSKRFTAT